MPARADVRSLLDLTWWVAASATLGLLPSENRIHLTDVQGVPVTPIHLTFVVAIGAWILTLIAERRPPRAPGLLAGVVGVLIGVGFVSAAVANGHNFEAFRSAAFAAAGLVLFVALVDKVRDAVDGARLSAVLVATFTLAAMVGIALWILPPQLTVELLGQDHTVAGARRLQATLGYPNTAAVAFSSLAFVAAGLLGSFRSQLARVLLLAALAVLLVATSLTLSRGALLGIAAGGATLVSAALLAGRRRLALGVTLAGAGGLALILVIQVGLVPIERLITDSERDFYGATYEAPDRITFEASDAPAQVALSVTNAGSAGWHPGEYRLGYHWLDGEDHENPAGPEIIRFGELGPDLGEVPSGERTQAVVSVTPLDDGPHLVAWDVYQVGGKWFSERGVPVATSVVPGNSGSPQSPDSSPGALLLYPTLLPEPSRSELWRAAVEMTSDAPMLGVGPGTFQLRYGPYLGYAEWDERIHANNTYLELAATTGIIGLATFVFVTIYAIGRQLLVIARRASPADGSWLLMTGLACAAVAFAAHGLVDYFLGFTGTLGLYWAILGIGLGLALGARERHSSGFAHDAPR